MSETPVTPVPSATVMILRDGPDGLQVLLGCRRQGRAFGAAHVFPGGVIDAADRRAAIRCAGLSAAEANRRMGLTHGARQYWVAAVREVFEETGLAFMQAAALSGEQLYRVRRALLAGEVSFERSCLDHGLTLLLDRLHYVSHWITPEARAVRFDTRFFVAALPAGQRAAHDGLELTDSVWLTPGQALERMGAGELNLAQPTLMELQRLGRFSDVAAALRWAGQRWRAGIATILPVVEGRGEGERIVLSSAAAAALRCKPAHD